LLQLPSVAQSSPSKDVQALQQAGRVYVGHGNGCFHLRHIRVRKLLDDGTLGLLLGGTSVIGFGRAEAADVGWALGDQIVEVNSHSVSSIDEFLDQFALAQLDGFPIDFGVLRQEDLGDCETSQDCLEDFFSTNNFMDLAGQIKSKMPILGVGESAPACDQQESGVYTGPAAENPYIQALKKRRDDLSCGVADWSHGVAESLAARCNTKIEWPRQPDART